MEPIANPPSFDSDQWQAVGVALSSLTALIGTALTIWGANINKQHEQKIKAAEIAVGRLAIYKKVSEIYENALLSASSNLSAMSFLSFTEGKELELLQKIEADINQALERAERIVGDRLD